MPFIFGLIPLEGFSTCLLYPVHGLRQTENGTTYGCLSTMDFFLHRKICQVHFYHYLFRGIRVPDWIPTFSFVAFESHSLISLCSKSMQRCRIKNPNKVHLWSYHCKMWKSQGVWILLQGSAFLMKSGVKLKPLRNITHLLRKDINIIRWPFQLCCLTDNNEDKR